MKNDIKISYIQLRALLVTTIIGVGVVSLPNELATMLEKDGWVVILLESLLIAPNILIIHWIFQTNPDKNYFQIGRENLGKIFYPMIVSSYFGFYK